MTIVRSLCTSTKSLIFLKPQFLQSPVSRHFLSVSPFTRPLSQAAQETTPIAPSETHHRPPFEQRFSSKWTVFGHLPEETDTQNPKPERPPNQPEKRHETTPKKPPPVNKQANEDAVIGRTGLGSTKKKRVQYVCESCGHTDGQWWGMCRMCEAPGSMKQFYEHSGNENSPGIQASENALKSWLPHQKVSQPLKLSDVHRGMTGSQWRIPLAGEFGSEVDRVIGGGLVPGSLVLVGGDPGIGKSTLLLQVSNAIAEQCAVEDDSVVYVSGEESLEQIGNRADRLGIRADNLFLYSSIEIEDILEKIYPLSPRILVVDSIQTVYLRGITGSPGGVSQVRECTSALLRFAKQTNVTVLLIGHVTKSGEIAGPRVLEHIVDVVLYLEGESSSAHRLLRPVKNRFGSTDELGVFEMAAMGLKPVANPSEMFLRPQWADSEVLAGLAMTIIMDGSRSFVIEIQALCAAGATVAQHVNGVPSSKADMIISVLAKQAGLMVQQSSVFLNVVGGLTLSETAGDLAVAAAICSSFLEAPIASGMAFVGEIGLGGEIRAVPRMDRRLATLEKMGFRKCFVGKLGLECGEFEGMEVVECRNLKEVITAVFK